MCLAEVPGRNGSALPARGPLTLQTPRPSGTILCQCSPIFLFAGAGGPMSRQSALPLNPPTQRAPAQAPRTMVRHSPPPDAKERAAAAGHLPMLRSRAHDGLQQPAATPCRGLARRHAMGSGDPAAPPKAPDAEHFALRATPQSSGVAPCLVHAAAQGMSRCTHMRSRASLSFTRWDRAASNVSSVLCEAPRDLRSAINFSRPLLLFAQFRAVILSNINIMWRECRG